MNFIRLKDKVSQKDIDYLLTTAVEVYWGEGYWKNRFGDFKNFVKRLKLCETNADITALMGNSGWVDCYCTQCESPQDVVLSFTEDIRVCKKCLQTMIDKF